MKCQLRCGICDTYSWRGSHPCPATLGQPQMENISHQTHHRTLSVSLDFYLKKKENIFKQLFITDTNVCTDLNISCVVHNVFVVVLLY